LKKSLLHPEEKERLQALRALEILDTPPEENYDAVVHLASSICGTPISTITLIDEDRQWFKAKVGVNHSENPREVSFCAHCILNTDILEVTDASKDPRFQDNPLVQDGPKIRFYAGAPLYTQSGLPIGSLCVIDKVPRELSPLQRQTLLTLAQQVSSELDLRLANKRLAEKNEETARLNSSLQQLFKVIAHDLRSPFQGFLGITELIEHSYDQFSSEDILEYIELLGDSASETYNLLENLLEWSTIEVGDVHFKPKPQSAKTLIENAISVLSTAASNKQIKIELVPPEHCIICVDQKMISSVIRNLVINAIKFSPEQSTIRITGEIIEDALILSIQDQGQGMSEAQIASVLTHGSIESSLGTKGERGSGIGLHLVHSFLEQHKSRLKLSSTPDQGSCFSFKLPLAVQN